jgi:hypothetical protein
MKTEHDEIAVLGMLQAIRKQREDFLAGVELNAETVSRALATYYEVVTAADVATFLPHRVNPACPDKSALFMRILESRRPLRHAPPTSFSYPWYALVEESGPFTVNLGNTMSLAGLVAGTRGAAGAYALVLNQCSYSVVSENGEARAIMQLLSNEADFDGAKFVELAEQSPVWTVRHGPWPSWELTVGVSNDGSARRDIAERPFPDTISDVVWGGWGLPINPVVVSRGSDAIREEQEKRERAVRGELRGLEALCYEGKTQAVYPEDPSQWDWLHYSRRGWSLRKSAQWVDFEIPYYKT